MVIATMAGQELSTIRVPKAPTAAIAALEPSTRPTQMALKHRRPRVSAPLLPSPAPTLTRTAFLLAFLMAMVRLAELHIAMAMAELCRMAMAELCRMARCSHRPPLGPLRKYPAAGTGHKMLKMWGGQATRKRWDQMLTAFHGAQRSFMIDPVIDTADLRTLPHRIGHSSILQSCVA